MDPRTNPFVPGAGVRPPEFAGREGLIDSAAIAFDRIKSGFYANSFLLLGLRGVGKTVLLNALHNDAKSKGFETIRIEVPDGAGGHLARYLVPNLNVMLQRLDRMKAAGDRLRRAAALLRNFAAIFQVKYEGISMGATPATPDAGSGFLDADLPELVAAVATAAAERGTAVALFIDEVQYLSKGELAALARTCHETAQNGHPFILVGAGLPQLAAMTGEAKSYAERLFLYPEVGPLADDAARKVLQEPVGRQGAGFAPEALDLIVAETQGYPYFLQTWGKVAWDVAKGPRIEGRDVVDARPEIDAYLDQHFFRTRFDRCSPAEHSYLRAMADLGAGPHRTGDIAAKLGAASSEVAATRRSLIEAGMIYSQRHGETAFTVPLFDEFMKRAIPDMDARIPRRRKPR
jgi:AAA ATPase domain